MDSDKNDEEEHASKDNECDDCLGSSDEECADLECADLSLITRKKRRKILNESEQLDLSPDESNDNTDFSHDIPSPEELEDQIDQCNIDSVSHQSSQIIQNTSHNTPKDFETSSCQHLIEIDGSTNAKPMESEGVTLDQYDHSIERSANEERDEVEDELIGISEITTPHFNESGRSDHSHRIISERANFEPTPELLRLHDGVKIPVASSTQKIILPTAEVEGTLPPFTHQRMCSIKRSVSISSVSKEEEEELSYDEEEIIDAPIITIPDGTYLPSLRMIRQWSTRSNMTQIEEHEDSISEDLSSDMGNPSIVEGQSFSSHTYPSFDVSIDEKKFNKHGKKCAAPGTVEFVRAFCQTDHRSNHYLSPYQSQRTLISSIKEETNINDINDTFDCEDPLDQSSLSKSEERILPATVRNPFRDRRVFSFVLVAVSCIFALGYGFVVQSNKLNDVTTTPQSNENDIKDDGDNISCVGNREKCRSPGYDPLFTTKPPSDSSNSGYHPSPSSVDIVSPDVPAYLTPSPTPAPRTIFAPGNFSTPITQDFYYVDGCMFNVHTENHNLNLNSIDILLTDTGGNEVVVEIWTKRGSYINDISGENWVNIFGEQTVTVVGNGPTKFTAIDPSYFKGEGSVDVVLRKNKVRAFYVTVKTTDESTKNLMISGKGDREGQKYLSNEDMSITDGTCFGYPFNENNDPLMPMRWFGTLNYETGFNPFQIINP